MKITAERLKKDYAKRRELHKKHERDINSYVYDALGRNRKANLRNKKSSQSPN